MDGLLPAFPSFDYETDKSSAGPRWRKWLGRLEKLFVAMALARDEDDSRRRALLLHYAGERVYDIYNIDKYFDKYFEPKTNVQMEIFNFRSRVQRPGESLDDYVTELRSLARNCNFTVVDHEILCQLTQQCRSNRLRRRVLHEPDKSLTDILELGRSLEMADAQASLMEKDSRQEASVNAVRRTTRSAGNRSAPPE